MTAILAGIMIGIGDVALLTAENKTVGALLFSVALLSIIRLRLPLYTGRIGGVVTRRDPLACLVILCENLSGVIVVIMLAIVSDNSFASDLKVVAENKFRRDWVSLFVAGMLCNILIHVAVTARNNAVTILCVMVFILSGYEHSIADFAFYMVSGEISKWLAVLLGNTAGGIMTEVLLSEKHKHR